MMRLDKFLATTLMISRKEAKALVKAKRVRLNDIVLTNVEQKINEFEDTVFVDQQPLNYQKDYYVMLYKPKGYISATTDNKEQTVLDLLPTKYQKTFPVGRLDKDTTGLLLLTTDGNLAHQLLSPKKHVPKIYIATLKKMITSEDIRAFEEGIVLDDGYLCLPAKLELINQQDLTVKVTIKEGKFHQIKRMFLARNNKVLELKRVAMGSLNLDVNLKIGDFRELTMEELESLQKK